MTGEERVARDFDVIVYGATGFTGRLVAEYLVQTGATRWAMAGRSAAKLAEVRDLIGAPAALALVIADADDPASLAAMAARAEVLLTTVGPYQLYGTPLVAACAAAGTAYVDLCGEPAWMRHMIDAHHEEAQRSGARIVFSCGFDSIPFDLGVLTLQDAAKAKFGKPLPRVKGRVRKMQGGFSGWHRRQPQGDARRRRQGPEPGQAARQPLRAHAWLQRPASADRADPRI